MSAPSFPGQQWHRAFHLCPISFVSHLCLLKLFIHTWSFLPHLSVPSFLGFFSPAVSVSVDLEGRAPVSSTHYHLARNTVQHMLTTSTLGSAPWTRSDIWASSESATWSIWVWFWNLVGAFLEVVWSMRCSDWFSIFLAYLFILFVSYQNE